MQGSAFNVTYSQPTGSNHAVMNNRQIQPVRNRDLQIIRQARPRGVLGQVWSVALQPNSFFLALPQAPSSSRQWFWVAILILALNGFSAVRQEALANGSGGGGDAAPITQDNSGGFSGKPGSFPISPSGGISSSQGGGFSDGSGVDLGSGAPTDAATGTTDITSTWVTALISATTILVGWFVLALILCEVPLFNGVRPSFSQNLQIAIWTTVPLGVMAGLQVIYLAAGGKVGAGGISGLLDYWKGYNDLSPIIRSILLSLTSRLTVFWIWSLVLIYIGGRMALNGKSWAVALVVVVWVLILVLVPVLTGAISAPVVVNNDLPEPITLPSDSESGILPEVTPNESDLSSTLVPDNGDQSGLIAPEATRDFSATNSESALSTSEPTVEDGAPD